MLIAENELMWPVKRVKCKFNRVVGGLLASCAVVLPVLKPGNEELTKNTTSLDELRHHLQWTVSNKYYPAVVS